MGRRPAFMQEITRRIMIAPLARSRGQHGRSIPSRTVLLVFVPLLAALLGYVAPAVAQDASGCESIARTWANHCPSLRDRCVRGLLCPPQSSVIEVGCTDADRLRVEVTPASPRSFRRVGEIGVSPIGEFADWSTAAPGIRDSFERVAGCLQHDASLLPSYAPPERAASDSHRRESLAVPWSLLAGVSALLALSVLEARRRGRAIAVGNILALLGLSVATLIIRRWIAPAAFFHQNGQGPFWVGFALEPDGRGSPYGTGYWEIFHAIGSVGRSPDAWIRGAQSIAAALVPASLWIVARASGTRARGAWCVAALVALSPIFARLAQSESYYATCGTLLALAAATLALGTSGSPVRRDSFVLGVLGAGFFIAQAARVIPVCWLPAAVIQAVLIARPGAGRTRWWLAVGAAIGIGAIVAVSSGPAMISVLQGSLGQRWLPQTRIAVPQFHAWYALALIALAAIVWASGDRRSAVVRGALLLGVLVLLDRTRLVRAESATINRAFATLWIAPVLALVVGLITGLREARARIALGGAAALGALVLGVLTMRADTVLPTDALECQWAEEWRQSLPAGSILVYPGQGRTYVLTLPVYGARSRVPIEPWVLTGGQSVPPALHQLGVPVYYYASSMCSTRESGGVCEAMAQRYRLAPIAERTFPARSSDSDLGFDASTVPVALYRIDGLR